MLRRSSQKYIELILNICYNKFESYKRSVCYERLRIIHRH